MLLWQALLCTIVLVNYGKSTTEDDPSGSFIEHNDRVERDTNPTLSVSAPVKNYTGVKSTKGGGKKKFAGGCISRPAEPASGSLQCSRDSGCIATCPFNYKFPNGVDELVLTCHDKIWHIRGTDWSTTPPCEPICMPECQNGGICVAPDQCNCTAKFAGPQCQFENKPCMDFPFVIRNAAKQCNQKYCTVHCMKNFVFPDGSTVANLKCENGLWQPTRSDWVSVPDCKPICNPPCMNGGKCLPNNVCLCLQDYRGSQCQYSVNVCAPKNLGFNGAVHCSGNFDRLSCTLKCIGGTFEYPPAPEYVCNYEIGAFKPGNVPQCIYDNDQILPFLPNNSHTPHFNYTWTVKDVVRRTMEQSWKSTFKYNVNKYVREHMRNTTTGTDIFRQNIHTPFVIDVARMEPKTCFIWGMTHYKTFDDKIYSFDSDCSHVLVQDSEDGSFVVAAQNSPGCATGGRCFRIVKIFVQNKEYVLTISDDGVPEFWDKRKSLPIPIYIPGIRVDTSAHFVVVTLDVVGVRLKWDGSLMLQIEASEAMWNRTMGLCGIMNGDISDDLTSKNGYRSKSIVTLVNSWKLEDIGKQCNEHPSTEDTCTSKSHYMNALDFCTKLLSDKRFVQCSETITYSELQSACIWEFCACSEANQKQCACNTMNVYVRQCAHKGITSLAGWRNEQTCPMSCDNGRIYLPCGPVLQPSCGYNVDRRSDNANCEEGCFCPEGTLLHAGKCITPEECPCRLRGKLFKPGTSVPKGCNTCTCMSGKWICTQSRCASRCAIIGDPHYMTFDGKHYDFMGKCKYYLMKGDNYSIEGENVACSGAISESMGFVPSDVPSCTKTVTINYKGVSIKLKQNQQILINGEDLTKLPTILSDIKIRAASSLFLVVDIPNGLQVWWDGISRVYINAPPQFFGKTWGLCGTFSATQKDDFLTPDGDIERAVGPFANKWKTSEQCTDVDDQEPKHSCDLNPQRREIAEEYCSKLRNSSTFTSCHWHVDPIPFYRDCLYDMCACEGDLKTCLCPMFAAYAKECAALGVQIFWRQDIDQCQINCNGGQVYQICGNSCTRSCADISMNPDCTQECVEGCNCPEGQTMDVHGECIPIGQCPCTIRGIEVRAGYREVRPGNKGQELCTCIGGVWKCRLATEDEIRDYPPIGDLVQKCVASKHLEITDCEPAEPRTCHNMHLEVSHSPATCKSGCVCKAGYVLNVLHGECIKEETCPCHHGGKSYDQGSLIQDDCNTCQCKNGMWDCSQRVCAGVCSAWGDSHYKTFDNKLYDFQGACDYIFAKGALSTEESFLVIVQNVPCGSSGAACSKSVTLVIGSDTNQETLTLTRDKDLSDDRPFKRIAVRSVELFVFLDVPDLGLVLQWDKGTRVYLRLDPKWKGRVKGLCGDYNDNSEDDFKTPSGGIAEASANLFADSWKKGQYCPEPRDVKDPCVQKPERKMWALKKCAILKSSLFRRCHSEVDVSRYMENCIFDTCGCDSGGDCECFCTSIAAYAHECNVRGVHVKWRSQDLCPLQCNEQCSTYSPCVSTCPRETCDTMTTLRDKLHMCGQDTCIEGCSFKACAENYVYVNNSYTECIPKSMCKPFCAEIDGTTYYEGDKVKDTDCQTCFCSRGQVICNGDRCTTVKTPGTVPETESQQCVDGWSIWINNDVEVKGKKMSDIEPLPLIRNMENVNGFGICEREHMADIKCRSTKEHKNPKDTGLDVECSLERGLYCKGSKDSPCIDFEISILCKCPKQITGAFTVTTELSTTTEAYNKCDPEHPSKQHPTNCHLYLQCTESVSGIDYVEQTCGPDQLYNPNTFACDWPNSVILLRPECSLTETTPGVLEWTTGSVTSPTPTPSTETSPTPTVVHCKDDETWSDCAVKCDRACLYYHDVLITEGYCHNADCIPGCVPKNKPECGPGTYFKDMGTCVDIAECTCRSRNGNPVSPGEIVHESECEVCQCVNNYYMCDDSACVTTERTEQTTVFTTERTSAISSTGPTTPTIVITHSTISPPAICDSNLYVPLVRPSISTDQVSFNASSSTNPLEPETLVIGNEIPQGPVIGWRPEIFDTDQWLDVTFVHPEPIYGIMMQGNPVDDQFVTSYNVMYSENTYAFTYVTDNNGEPHVFRGPVDSAKPVRQIFDVPVEARVIRINPQTWHNGIAMKVEILGCQEYTTTAMTEKSTEPTFWTTPTILITSPSPVCDEPMGVENGLLQPEQVSSLPSFTSLLPNLRLTSPDAWRPKLDNQNQYVQFDFLEPRNLTGIVTAGGGDSWTSAYKVLYSMDSRDWNPIIGADGNEVEFLGNFDGSTVRKNFFEKPLHARFLRIQPTKWHQHISLRVEILGCFLPYPLITSTIEPTTPTPTTPEIISTTTGECDVCHGVPLETVANCTCQKPYWWNGKTCVQKHDCECIVNDVSYSVGTVYDTADCQRCICSLGGVSTCSPKKCAPCKEPGLRPVLIELCTCVCKPCPSGMRLCPTSKTCINETSWCNGVQDCPDDETGCEEIKTTETTETAEITEITEIMLTSTQSPQTTIGTASETSPTPSEKVTPSVTTAEYSTASESYITTTPTSEIHVTPVTTKPPPENVCKRAKCAAGYKAVYIYGQNPYSHETDTIFGVNGVKGARDIDKYIKKIYIPGRKHHNNRTKTHNVGDECQQFTCIPKEKPVIDIVKPEDCPTPSCPPSYAVVYEKLSMYKFVKCPRYTCKPPVPHEVTCKITSRRFSTFDNVEYNYDICNHILAREMFDNKWYVILEQRCDAERRCSKVLTIVVDDDQMVLYTDLHAEINGNVFSPAQVARLCHRPGPYQISRVGNFLKIYSRRYGFWTLWDMYGNVQIGISRKWAGGVDGLCGYFDESPLNDKQLPNGDQAKNTREFGNSWAVEEAPECELQVCPHEYREQVWKICNAVKDPTFGSCFDAGIDKFVSRCFETACNCLNSNRTYDDCRCETLTNFVTDCEAEDRDADLSNWRSVHDCPTDCPAPFVHRDCYKYECEISCDNLKEIDPCPAVRGMCFSGCFCPDGMVRKGKTCVRPTECRDCSCDVFGNSKLVTFDKRTFQSNGNCTYVLSRDVTRKVNGQHAGHSYEILATNENCKSGLCVVAVTVLFGEDYVRVGQLPPNDSWHSRPIEIIVNGFEIFRLPHTTAWLSLERTSDDNVRLLIPSIQLEIIVFQHNFAFVIKLPSHTFGERMEGLCGNCNVDDKDDLRMSNGELTQDIDEFDESWTVIEPPRGSSIVVNNCTIHKRSNCTVLPVESDPCQKLMTLPAFQPCHALIDPKPYVEACQETLCTGANYCDTLEAYARQCLTVDVCPNWRTPDICPYTCPSYLEYQPCGPTCVMTCNDISEDECAIGSEEGCFCPEGHVLHNDTCVLKEKCFVCDDEGHVENDVWYPDKCSKCTCMKGVVNCQQIECPISETVCQENMKLVPVAETQNDCCPKHICVPESPETPRNCPEEQIPVCGFGQMMKTLVDDGGCQRFICVCLPPDDCPTFDVTPEAEDMEPGIVKVMNNSGCCPRPVFVCKPEACPTTVDCPPYHKSVMNQQKDTCCPEYICEPPKDRCVYTATPGIESNTTQLITRKIGGTWDRDICTKCTCELTNNKPTPNCIKMECSDVTRHPDVKDYILDANLVPGQCCPNFERSACKVDEMIYEVGEIWRPNPEDPCTTMQCIRDSVGIQKQTIVRECNTTCDYGYSYQPPEDTQNTCCGKCIPTGCMVEEQLKNIGDVWYSADHCVTFSCLFVNGSVFIKEATETCPELDNTEKYEYEFEERPIEGKCCPEIVRVACRDKESVYSVEEKWKSSDKCVTMKCVIGDHGVTKEKEVERCVKNCQLGFVYQEPTGDECCGKCEAAYCVLGDVLYNPDDTWTVDCTTYTCTKHGDQISMISSSAPCPDITGCPPHLIYEEDCCKRCNMTTVNLQGSCAAQTINESSTIKSFNENHVVHGFCTNLEPVFGVKECRGTCDSSTYFNSKTWKQENDCQCCQGLEYEDIVVDLSCDDGNVLKKRLSVPSLCSCRTVNCESTKRPGNRKPGVKG